MRRLFYAVAALGVAFGAASCAKDGGNVADRGQKITVIAGQNGFTDEAGTRVYHGEDGNGYWHPTEESIGIFIDDATIKNVKLSGTTTDGGLTVEFGGSLGKTISAGDYTLYAYYPYGSLTNTSQTSVNARVLVPTKQKPTLTSYDPTAAVMYATPKTVTATATTVSAVTTNFNFAVAFVKVQFADVAAQIDNEPVLSFKMTVANTITGRVELNLQTGAFGNWFSSAEYTNKYVEATFDASDNFVLNGTNGITLGIVPTTLMAGSTVVVEALTENYKISKTITVPSATQFNAGNIRVMKISAPTVKKMAYINVTSPTSHLFNLGAEASTPQTIAISSNVEWIAVEDYIDGSGWIHLTTDSGNGNGSAVFTVDANTGNNQRTGSITITDLDDIEVVVTIVQAGQVVVQKTNYSVDWIIPQTTTGGGATGTLAATNNNSSGNITVGVFNKTGGNWQNGSLGAGTFGGTDFSKNTNALSPEKYMDFTVTSAKVFSITNLIMAIRLTAAGPCQTDVQYKIGAGSWTAITGATETYTKPSSTTNFPARTWDLSGCTALQNILGGTVVTLRVIPMKDSQTAATGNWSVVSATATSVAVQLNGNYVQ